VSKQVPQHIAIAGNIGAGKTTLSIKLAQHYGWRLLLESVDDNPYLEDFYFDMKKWAFPLQIYFLHNRFNQVAEIRQGAQTVIQDRSIYEDAYIFAKNLRESLYLNERDYQNYLSLFHSVIQLIEAPDLLIYLRADIPKLVEQIQKRGRPYENAISIRYLENLNRHYESWIATYDYGELMVIEVDGLDYLESRDDFQFVTDRINKEFLSKYGKPYHNI